MRGWWHRQFGCPQNFGRIISREANGRIRLRCADCGKEWTGRLEARLPGKIIYRKDSRADDG